MKMKMSEYQLPLHIQEEIMKRLPVKSLIQFRCVSKEWRSLIDSSEFIAAHSLHRHTQQQHLLVSYEDPMDEQNYVSYIDDESFPQQRSMPTIPLIVKQLFLPSVVGSSHGLVCVYGSDPKYKTKLFVLWNPSIRKSIVVAAPELPYVGFGVCPVTKDPKIVSITQCSRDEPDIKTKVMVYTLSSGKWRRLSNNLPTQQLHDWLTQVVTDRFIYWRVELPNHNMIMSFDVTNESFEAIDLPDSLANRDLGDLYISKVRESLAMLQYSENNCDVWMMEHGVQRLFTKLFTIKTPYAIVGFRKSGVPIMQLTDDPTDYDDPSKLVVYEPNSEHKNVLETSESPYTFFVNSYMKTLLLLGRSDCISY